MTSSRCQKNYIELKSLIVSAARNRSRDLLLARYLRRSLNLLHLCFLLLYIGRFKLFLTAKNSLHKDLRKDLSLSLLEEKSNASVLRSRFTPTILFLLLCMFIQSLVCMAFVAPRVRGHIFFDICGQPRR